MTHGPLGWLPSAQRSYSVTLDLWEPLEQRLTAALAGLREGSFLICQLPGAQGEDGATGQKYLQYALDDGEHGRVLTAEASALKYQGVLDPAARAQQSLIDAMGWSRPDDDNHRRTYPWPLDLDAAIVDSMRILRDVWGVTHPSLVRIGEPTSFGHSPLADTDDSDAILERLATWIESLGGTTQPFKDDEPGMLAKVLDVIAGVSLDSEDGRIDIDGLVGNVSATAAGKLAVLHAVSDEAIVGCPRLVVLEGGEAMVQLGVSVPVAGLTADGFGRHLTWLAASVEAVSATLDAPRE